MGVIAPVWEDVGDMDPVGWDPPITLWEASASAYIDSRCAWSMGVVVVVVLLLGPVGPGSDGCRVMADVLCSAACTTGGGAPPGGVPAGRSGPPRVAGVPVMTMVLR